MTPSSHVWLADDLNQRFFGPGPYELLMRVKRTHSLNAASKEMGMAYTKACHLIGHAEEGLGIKLLNRRAGGVSGGGSVLTPEGEDILERYDAWSQTIQRDMEASFYTCFAGIRNVKPLGCVVMASGVAHRFGRQKLLELFQGVPVLKRVVQAAQASVFDVVVASRWDEVRALAQQSGVAVTTPQGNEISSTVRAGIEALGKRAGYLFLAGDQPLITTESLNALASTLERHPKNVVRLSWEGSVAAPVLFPGYLAQDLSNLKGDVGGSALLKARPDLRRSTVLVEAASALEVKDIDTPQALSELEQAFDSETEENK